MQYNTAIILGISMTGPLLGSLAGVSFRPGKETLCAMLGFAGGTMLGISFLQLIPESVALSAASGCIAGILAGMLAMFLLGRLMLHENGNMREISLMMVAAIFLHNFPEGIAMAVGEQLPGKSRAAAIALAIAVHDIPEGICTSAPYYYATGRRMRAFLISASTALPVLAGFFAGRTLLLGMPESGIGVVMGAAAGLMIYVSCEELLPTAFEAERRSCSIAAMILGVIFVILLEST